jgi:hypothetical protein
MSYVGFLYLNGSINILKHLKLHKISYGPKLGDSYSTHLLIWYGLQQNSAHQTWRRQYRRRRCLRGDGDGAAHIRCHHWSRSSPLQGSRQNKSAILLPIPGGPETRAYQCAPQKEVWRGSSRTTSTPASGPAAAAAAFSKNGDWPGEGDRVFL